MEEKVCPYHLPPGTELLGRYQIGRVLGEGGFGITYEGLDQQLDRKVAIKEYFPVDKASRLSENSLEVVRYANTAPLFEKGLESFLKEARALAKMDKLWEIVGVTDHFEENGTAYIVMEFVEGITFKEFTAKHGGRVPAEELMPLVEPLLLSLEKMHQMGLIHRDISPENLMLENGTVRLLDLGSAREPGSGNATVTVMLKRDYAPLEQYLGKVQGPWTDVYGLCATLYYCLTGQVPPPSIDRLGGEKLPSPRELGADISLSQERALLRGMGLQPRRRFQSMSELHKALYGGVKNKSPKRRVPRLRIWLGVGGGAALLLTAFLLASRPSAPVEALAPVTSAGATLTAQMEDESLDSITIQAGTRLMVAEPVTIIKPLYIEPGAELSLAGHIVVAGEGRLEVEGELLVETLLQLTEGGSAHVAEGGELTLNGYCWTEQESDLQIDGGSTPDSHVMVINEDELFQDAVHVETYPQYLEALEDEGVPAIIFDRDMEVPGEGDLQGKPLLIPEGVTVTGALEGSSLWPHGSVLINRGTIQMDFHMNSLDERPVYLINYGRMDGRGDLDGAGLLLNLGEVRTVGMYVGMHARGTDICNVGVFTASRTETEGGLFMEKGSVFLNGGTTYREDGVHVPNGYE